LVQVKSEQVQCSGLKKAVPLHPIVGRHDRQSVTSSRESPSVPDHSASRNAVTAVIIFFAAHFALLVGVTTPEKFYFDEVHYVPAAQQMLEPVMPAPMLSPMHPPLAKQLMALSIRTFGDVPLGWRYPSVLFGSLAIVAMYLCCLACRGMFRKRPSTLSSRPHSRPAADGNMKVQVGNSRLGPSLHRFSNPPVARRRAAGATVNSTRSCCPC
jgi:hypothetical protein